MCKNGTYRNAKQYLCDLLVNTELEAKRGPFSARKLTLNQHT